MSDLKMSNAFLMPLKTFGSDSVFARNDNCYGQLATPCMAEYAVKAINAYDSNQELIAKQQEQIELLRDALQGALRIESLWLYPDDVAPEHFIEAQAMSRMRETFKVALAATAKGRV